MLKVGDKKGREIKNEEEKRTKNSDCGDGLHNFDGTSAFADLNSYIIQRIEKIKGKEVQ